METDNFAYLLPFIMLAFGCSFMIIGRWRAQPALSWGWAFLLVSLAFATPIIFSRLPFPYQAAISNVLFLAGFYFYGEALLRRFEAKRYGALRAGFAVAVFAAISYAIFVEHSLRAELLLSDIACILLLAFPLVVSAPKARLMIDKALLVVIGLIVLETLTRLAIFLITDATDSFEDFLASDYAFLMQVTASVLGLVLGLTALAGVALDVILYYRDAAEKDPLTSLLNRRGFERVIANLDADWRQSGAAIICDIDHFKRINDTYGHATGDRVIAGLAELLSRHLPAGVSIARFGGEEFVVLLPEHSLAEAGALANLLRLNLAARDWSDLGFHRQITASFGVAAVARGDHSPHDAIARADKQLYAAKVNGRNTVMVEGASPAEAPALHIVPQARKSGEGAAK
ncbi:GGDEF domain-containing protein [Rhizobium sp. LjRoot30]|uniref:GGDEF domain-containing protein n=1 Tax=Rhizobium sp. LjRoot30 TaxID=3342320 RepID=UPI003ECDBE6C